MYVGDVVVVTYVCYRFCSHRTADTNHGNLCRSWHYVSAERIHLVQWSVTVNIYISTVHPWLSEPRLSECLFIQTQKLLNFHEFHYNLHDGGHLLM